MKSLLHFFSRETEGVPQAAICSCAKSKELIEAAHKDISFAGLCTLSETGSHPTFLLPCAIGLFNEYSLVLSAGPMPFCIYFDRKHWRKELNKDVPTRCYGSFYNDMTDEEKDELPSIYGFGLTFEEAVFKCVYFARIAGVI